jgi:hypothetical protein
MKPTKQLMDVRLKKCFLTSINLRYSIIHILVYYIFVIYKNFENCISAYLVIFAIQFIPIYLFYAFKYVFLIRGLQLSTDSQRGPWHKNV